MQFINFDGILPGQRLADNGRQDIGTVKRVERRTVNGKLAVDHVILNHNGTDRILSRAAWNGKMLFTH